MVLPSQIEVQNQSYKSVYDYFDNHKTYFSIIYGSYMAGTFLVSVLFISNIYQKLRREMLHSNKLLYIIDFEALKDFERASVPQFLQNY